MFHQISGRTSVLRVLDISVVLNLLLESNNLRLRSRLGHTGILLRCHVLGSCSSSVDDDLSYETKEANQNSYKPQPEGEMEMFHSKGLGFIIIRFFFETNFND